MQEVKPEDLIPKAQKGNFTGKISVKGFLELSNDDYRKIEEFCADRKWEIDLQKIPQTLIIDRQYEFKDSTLIESDTYWTIELVLKKRGQKKFREVTHESEEWQSIIGFIHELIPQISYFPTFVFNFPEKIYLSNPPKDSVNAEVNAYYVQIVQDILDSLPKKMSIQTHIVDRAERTLNSENIWDPFKYFRSDEREQINHVVLQIGNKVTDIVFSLWNEVFKVKIKDKVVNVGCFVEPSKSDPSKPSVYLEFKIRDGDSNYNISERSLGFRWFFCFLLFTQFRASRKNRSSVFLFDEPASNLHSRAQEQLLKSFSEITKGSNLIIYSTHSHYMIDPRLLEGAFIAFNDAIDYEDNPAEEAQRKVVDTNIHLNSYREFANRYPDKVTYFQPILDTLQYTPSRLEFGENAVFVEGKNDFYCLQYFKDVVLKNPKDFVFMPGNGAAGVGPLISLYLGWGKKFIVLLDDDTAGTDAAKKYKEDFLLGDQQVCTIANFLPALKKKKMEAIVSTDGITIIGKGIGKAKPTKKDIGRFFQEKLAVKEAVNFDSASLTNAKTLIAGIESRFK